MKEREPKGATMENNGETHMTPEQEQLKYDVQRFVEIEKNRIPAQEGRRCVDGRYEDDSMNGFIARAGADFGYVMSLLTINKEKNLGYTPEECVEKVYSAITQDGGTFYMHTDDHALHAEGDKQSITGCGHITRAMNEEFAPRYGLAAEDVKKALVHIRNVHGHEIKEVILHGDHEEKGVIINMGEETGLKHQDEEQSFFHYSKVRDDAFIETLVPSLGHEEITIEDFKNASDRHLQATLKLLADGASIFEVNTDEQEPKARLVGVVS